MLFVGVLLVLPLLVEAPPSALAGRPPLVVTGAVPWRVVPLPATVPVWPLPVPPPGSPCAWPPAGAGMLPPELMPAGRDPDEGPPEESGKGTVPLKPVLPPLVRHNV